MPSNKAASLLAALGCGTLFGVGLVVSGMVNPLKVIGFLNILRGPWDPTLVFVMGAALALNLVAFRFLLRMPVSLLGFKLALPTQKQVDWRVVVGPIIFGIGWGFAGICPGPGLLNVIRLPVSEIVPWLVAFLLGIFAFRAFDSFLAAAKKKPQ